MRFPHLALAAPALRKPRDVVGGADRMSPHLHAGRRAVFGGRVGPGLDPVLGVGLQNDEGTGRNGGSNLKRRPAAGFPDADGATQPRVRLRLEDLAVASLFRVGFFDYVMWAPPLREGLGWEPDCEDARQ